MNLRIGEWQAHSVTGDLDTIMAGLVVETPINGMGKRSTTVLTFLPNARLLAAKG
jgi:hypothetical protein